MFPVISRHSPLQSFVLQVALTGLRFAQAHNPRLGRSGNLEGASSRKLAQQGLKPANQIASTKMFGPGVNCLLELWET